VAPSGKGGLYSYSTALATKKPLPAGQLGVGTVRAITRQALYVEAGDTVCVIARGQATLSRIIPLAAGYRLEQTVSAIDGSIVAAQPCPWQTVALPRGATACGIVIDTTFKGDRPAVLVEIVPGIVGIADLPASARLKRGDKVTGKILHFNLTRQRVRIELTHVGGRALPSPAAAKIIALLEVYGPLPVAAVELICPSASALARRARGTISVRDLGGEPGLWLTGQTVELPSFRQRAFGWFIARAFEAGCSLKRSSKESWLFTTPRGRQTIVVVFPDRPPPAGGIVLLPYGVEVFPGGLSISVAELENYHLTEILQKQK